MSNMLDYTKHELNLIGLKDDSEDEMNVTMRKHILHMVKEFEEEGHSGHSASYALAILKKVLNWKPLTDLTGEDDEWMEIADDLYQNKRAFDVFKDANGAYWSGGVVFWEWSIHSAINGGKPFKSYFTSKDSRVPITFPFSMPSEPEYREANPDR